MKDYRSKRSSKAWAISDRSGMRYPMSEMIKEPGTGYFIHRSESDGRYNYVDHPQAHIDRYAQFGDPFPVENARPDIIWADVVGDLDLQDQNGAYVTDQNDNHIQDGYGSTRYGLQGTF